MEVLLVVNLSHSLSSRCAGDQALSRLIRRAPICWTLKELQLYFGLFVFCFYIGFMSLTSQALLATKVQQLQIKSFV